MSFLKDIFKKNDAKEKSKKDIPELIEKIISENDKTRFVDIQKAAKQQPNNPFFQDLKNKEEFLIRHKVSGLAALMAMDELDSMKACKEIIEYAEKGLKINPNSAYLLYFRGRSRGDTRLLKEGLEDLDRAIKINPNYADVYIERGYIKQKMDNFSGAKNDYDKGVQLNPSLQSQVNSYLGGGKNSKNMTIPFGITLKFIVTPSLSENHQKGLRYLIIKKSGLDQYFKNISVTFEDVYKGKSRQMLVKVSCPEPIIAIEVAKEGSFYKDLDSNFSEWIINAIQSNTEMKYKAEKEQFLYTYSLKELIT